LTLGSAAAAASFGTVAAIMTLPSATAQSASPAFAAPVTVGTGASEPGIDVASNGTLYVDGPDGLLSNGTSPSPVWRSVNGGDTWTQTPPGLRQDSPGGGDSQIAVDPTNGHLAFIDLWLGASTASTSTDQGNTWTAQPLGGPPVQDRPWIASAGGGVVYQAVHQIPAGIVVSKSVDGGLSYLPDGVAATPVDQTGCICPPGNVIAQGGTGALGTGDKVGVIYADSSGGIKFASSNNGGLTFSNAAVAPDSSGASNSNFPVVANAGNNHLAAVWLNEGPSSDSVQLSQSTDWGKTWSAPTTIVSGGTSVYPWVAARGSTIGVSLYHTSTVAATPDAVPAGSSWFESALQSTDGGSTFSSLVTADPTPSKTGAVCTAGTGCSADRELGDFQSLVVDASGHLDLAYNRVASGGSTTVLFAQGS
jgi:hypothetical protein